MWLNVPTCGKNICTTLNHFAPLVAKWFNVQLKRIIFFNQIAPLYITFYEISQYHFVVKFGEMRLNVVKDLFYSPHRDTFRHIQPQNDIVKCVEI